MDRIVICAFRSDADAASVRAALLERGYRDVQVQVIPDASLDDRGAAARVARTFGGRLEPEQLARYELAVENGMSLVAVQVPDDDAATRVAAVLDHFGRRARTQPAPEEPAALQTALEPSGDRGGEGGPPVYDPRDTLTRPRIYVLPG